RKHNFFVSRKGRAACSRSCPGSRSNRGSFTASGKSTDNAPESRATTGENRGAFPFALFRKAPRCGLNRNVSAMDADGIQLPLEARPTLKLAERLGIGHGTGPAPTLRNRDCAPDHHVFCDAAGECVTRFVDFGPQGRAETDGN